ncbi:MAG: hypothetical protein E2O47_07165 [Gemmatimonadetes bacterium]|nr:MAG: hypothetical protein E2O47_07165 [Gemmatimonadota bacterium]
MHRAVLLLGLLAAGATTVAGQTVAPDPGTEGWRADLALLALELPRIHPAPFTKVSQDEWDAAVFELEGRLPGLTGAQATVAFQQLVALIQDGHTSLNPLFEPTLRRYVYPVEFYRFEDGVFIRRAASEVAELVGARVLRYGAVAVDSALAAVAPTVSADNRWWIRGQAALRLSLVSVALGLGLVDDPDALTLVIEHRGVIDTVTMKPVTLNVTGHGAPFPPASWVDMAPADGPLWLAHPGELWWTEWLPESNTLYVMERAIINTMGSETHAAFWLRVFATVDSLPVERLILDLRTNGGGNGFLARHIVKGMVQRPQLDRPGGLYVITGRSTFSAAVNLMNELEYYTNATFVGEPPGSSPRSFGDHDPVQLPNSGLTVLVSTVWHQGHNPFDGRRFVAPRLYAPITSSEYAQGVDPVLAAIQDDDASANLIQRLETAAIAHDSVTVRSIMSEALANPLYRFRGFEPDVNLLGYRFLRQGNTDAALMVFRQNAADYPHSANVFDSLADGLVQAGMVEEAKDSYRKALAIDPDYPPSVSGLARLESAGGH